MAQQQESQETEPTDTEPEPQPPTQPEPEPTTTPVTPTTTPTPTTTEPTTTTATTTLPEIEETITFPSILTSDSTDIDSDDLTDEEEEVFEVDSGTWDTDGDGYFDGQEVRNLYHPNQQAPAPLPDSDLVEEYVSPQFGYRVFYPSQWESASVNADGRAVLFNAITGDYILVRAVEKEPNESFNEWFTRKIEDQSRTELTEFENKYNVTGYRRDDDLVAYFPGEEEVYILIYNPGVQDQIPYREIMKMMVQSFRLEDSLQVLPRQNVVPQSNRQTTQTTTQTTTTQATTTEETATTTDNQNTTTQTVTTTEDQTTTTPTTTVTSS